MVTPVANSSFKDSREEMFYAIAEKYHLSWYVSYSGTVHISTPFNKVSIGKNQSNINPDESEQNCLNAYQILTKRGISVIPRELASKESEFGRLDIIYRIVMLAGESLLVLSKEQHYLIGNGVSTVKDMYSDWGSTNTNLLPIMNPPPAEREQEVPPAMFFLNLNYNCDRWDPLTARVEPNRKLTLEPISKQLPGGTTLRFPPDKITTAITIAEKVTQALEIPFAMVEIARMHYQHADTMEKAFGFQVLWVYPEVPLEDFVKEGLIDRQTVTGIYERVICKTLNLPFNPTKDESKQPPVAVVETAKNG